VAPMKRMRVWHESGRVGDPGALKFDAADAGEPNLGYIVENRVLQAALLDAFVDAGRHVGAGATQRVCGLNAASVSVETSRGTLSARLVIGGRWSAIAVRQAVGLTAEASD